MSRLEVEKSLLLMSKRMKLNIYRVHTSSVQTAKALLFIIVIEWEIVRYTSGTSIFQTAEYSICHLNENELEMRDRERERECVHAAAIQPGICTHFIEN